MTVRTNPRKLATEAKLAGLTLPAGETATIARARAAALSRLTEMGVPQRRDEYWRFTDPALLERAGETEATSVTLPAELANIPRVGAGASTAEVASLADALETEGHWSQSLFGELETQSHSPVQRPLAAYVTAFATDGVTIRATGDAGQMLHDHGAAPGALVHSVIRIEPGAQLTLIEVGNPTEAGLSLTEVDIGAGGTFHHIRLQNDLVSGATYTAVRLDEGAAYHGFTLGANGLAVRNETYIALTGADAKAHIGGAWIGQGPSHHDDTVFIKHGAPSCESRQVYRSVLGRGAIAAFQGKILVDQIAQKTDGYQLSQALLLDDEAQFLGKPELEIYADDVKCSHGSTTGSIDETQLFYLRSRGVPERQARHLLVLAFLNETLDEIQDDALRAAIAGHAERLAAHHLT